VEIWRKLQRYGTLPLRSSGYVLPNSALNQERMEWLATAIRDYKGQASVVQAQGFDDLPGERLKQRFLEARAVDYQKLLHEAKKIVGLPRREGPPEASTGFVAGFSSYRTSTSSGVHCVPGSRACSIAPTRRNRYGGANEKRAST